MKIVIRFLDGLSRIDQVPDWVVKEKRIVVIKEGFSVEGEARPFVQAEYKGKINEVPVFQEIGG